MLIRKYVKEGEPTRVLFAWFRESKKKNHEELFSVKKSVYNCCHA
jgi:hypothetical protein